MGTPSVTAVIGCQGGIAFPEAPVNTSASIPASSPILQSHNDATTTRFLGQIRIAEKIAAKSIAEKAKSLSETKSAAAPDQFSDEKCSGTDPSAVEKPLPSGANDFPKSSTPIFKAAVEKRIPAAKVLPCVTNGLQILRSDTALNLNIGGLAGLHTGESISTLVLSVVGACLALFNAIKAVSNVSDNVDKEEALNAVLIRDKDRAKLFFENCNNDIPSSPEDANAYQAFIAAASQHSKFSERSADAVFLSRLIVAKEAIFVKIAALNVAQLVIGIAAVPIALVTTVVLSALTVGLGLVANAYDIYQGVQTLVAANEKREKALVICNSLEKIVNDEPGQIDADLAIAISSFYATAAKDAESDAGFAILRIVKGIAGVVVAVLGAALLIMSGGAAAPIAAVLGGASSAIFFAGMMAKAVMDVKKHLLDTSQKQAYLDLITPSEEQPALLADKTDYSNRYIMARTLAKTIVTDLDLEADGPARSMLSAIGFGTLDMKIIKAIKKSEGAMDKKVESVEILVRKKMGIA